MATFVTAGKKTKAIIRKQGHRTLCKTFIKKTDALVWAKIESEIERGLFEDTAKAKTTRFKLVLDEYYQSCTQRQLKGLIIRSHSRTIAAHLGSYMIADINSELLASYRDTRLQCALLPSNMSLGLFCVHLNLQSTRKVSISLHSLK